MISNLNKLMNLNISFSGLSKILETQFSEYLKYKKEQSIEIKVG